MFLKSLEALFLGNFKASEKIGENNFPVCKNIEIVRKNIYLVCNDFQIVCKNISGACKSIFTGK